MRDTSQALLANMAAIVCHGPECINGKIKKMNIQTLFDTLDVHIEGSVDDTIRKQYQVTKIKSLSSSCTMKLYAIKDNLNNIGDNDDSVITGFDDISLQYSEAQGKYAGLCIIEAYHKSRK
ncbi:hypothetical protein RhiirA5_417477 [Rhizophagus irregularis]|nr:hypothetical protein GLOIN_2v1763053 [Rhizophagus irregularis DAOM 181602=DAOM 197198]PKC08009.1 hypothetical protein RhiirA5_417477 [Rhizophagus irregularis]POG81495.1 hypothetical protein GLOIN_2v1763053 [Rhizophagus irregularis DAOM 181602=DAOM 197198]|eukprot:XP_025188361.1 hypothetical protein GLOIN_2v1763053 [Rhizophagus irregularis DAOM 181602=DAOM 197198]